VQRLYQALPTLGDAKPDWWIIQEAPFLKGKYPAQQRNQGWIKCHEHGWRLNRRAPYLSNANHVHDILSSLDFFVVQDIFLSRTAQYADVILAFESTSAISSPTRYMAFMFPSSIAWSISILSRPPFKNGAIRGCHPACGSIS
jgi:anaerobic selenocysteine-containing dehydrogenase